MFNIHHEVIDVHGSGSLLAELGLLQNALDLLGDAEISWNVLSSWETL